MLARASRLQGGFLGSLPGALGAVGGRRAQQVTIDVNAPVAGTITEILAEVDATVKVRCFGCGSPDTTCNGRSDGQFQYRLLVK